MYSGKKAQHDFPKMRGGGIKGRLELFQKFIRFGSAALPLGSNLKSNLYFASYCFRVLKHLLAHDSVLAQIFPRK